MINKTFRYIAFALIILLVVAWLLGIFFRKKENSDAKQIIQSTADSITFAMENIENALHRVDSMVFRMDSVQKVVLMLNEKVKQGNNQYQNTLQKNMKEIEVIKAQIYSEEAEIEKLKEKLKQLK